MRLITWGYDMTDTESLLKARELLSDVRYSIVVKTTTCGECSAKRYDNFTLFQVRDACQGAITRIDKAITLIEQGGDNGPQVTRKSRKNNSR